jgi:hypothetical protein
MKSPRAWRSGCVSRSGIRRKFSSRISTRAPSKTQAVLPRRNARIGKPNKGKNAQVSVGETCACFQESSRRSHISIGPWVMRGVDQDHKRRRGRHDLLASVLDPRLPGVNFASFPPRSRAAKRRHRSLPTYIARILRRSFRGDANASRCMWRITIRREPCRALRLWPKAFLMISARAGCASQRETGDRLLTSPTECY